MPEKITFTVNSDGLDATLTNIHEVLLSNQKTTLEHHTALDNLNARMLEITAMLKSLQIQESARITSSPAQLQIREAKQVPQVKHKEVQTTNSEEDSTSSTVSCDSRSDSSRSDWDIAPAKVDSAPPDVKTPDEMKVLVVDADADGTDEIKARPAKLSLSPEALTFTPRQHKEDGDLVSPTSNQSQHVTRSPKSIETVTALNVVELLLEGGLQHVNNELSTVVEMAEDAIGPAIVAGLKDSLQHVLGCRVEDLRFQLTEFKMGSTRYCAAQLIQNVGRKRVAQSYAIPWIGDTDAKPKFIKMFAMRSDLEKFVEHALGELPVGGLKLLDLSAIGSVDGRFGPTHSSRNNLRLMSRGSFGTLRDSGSQHDSGSMYKSSGGTLRDMYHQSDRGSVGSLSRGTNHNAFTSPSNATQSGSYIIDESVSKPYIAKPGPHNLQAMPSRGGTSRGGLRGSPSGLSLRDRPYAASHSGQDVSNCGTAEGVRGGPAPRYRGPHERDSNNYSGEGTRRPW